MVTSHEAIQYGLGRVRGSVTSVAIFGVDCLIIWVKIKCYVDIFALLALLCAVLFR